MRIKPRVLLAAGLLVLGTSALCIGRHTEPFVAPPQVLPYEGNPPAPAGASLSSASDSFAAEPHVPDIPPGAPGASRAHQIERVLRTETEGSHAEFSYEGSRFRRRWVLVVTAAKQVVETRRTALEIWAERTGFGLSAESTWRRRGSGDEGLAEELQIHETDRYGPARDKWELRVSYVVEQQAPPLSTVSAALQRFPEMGRGKHPPKFLIDVVSRFSLHRVDCSGRDEGCNHWTFELEPSSNHAVQMRRVVAASRVHGFRFEHDVEDAKREDVYAYQECSTAYLWFRIEEERLTVRLQTSVGGRFDPDSVVRCSRAARPVEKPVAPPGGAIILQIPVLGWQKAQAEKIERCYARHQERRGLRIDVGDWKKRGNFIERSLLSGGNRPAIVAERLSANACEASVGFTHLPNTGQPAQAVFANLWRMASDGTALVAVHAEQRDAGGGRLTLRASVAPAGARITTGKPPARIGRAVSFDAVPPTFGDRERFRALLAETKHRDDAGHLELIGERADDLARLLQELYPFDEPDCRL